MNVILICLIVALHSKTLLANLYSLSDDASTDQLQQADGNCVYKPNMGSIIKTNESIEAKAVFLQFHTGQTKEGCLEKCCSLTDCNLAVYERKDIHSCYLFNCGTEEKSRCRFSHHEDYMSMELSPRPVSQKSKSTKASQDKHENELEGLTGKNDPVNNPVSTKTTATSKSTTGLDVPTTKSPLTQKSGEVFGECTDEGSCKDDRALCEDGVCICEHGYDFTNKYCKRFANKNTDSVGNSQGRDGRPPIRVNQGSQNSMDKHIMAVKQAPATKERIVPPQTEESMWTEKSSKADSVVPEQKLESKGNSPVRQSQSHVSEGGVIPPSDEDESDGEKDDDNDYDIHEKQLVHQAKDVEMKVKESHGDAPQKPAALLPSPSDSETNKPAEPPKPITRVEDLPNPKPQPKLTQQNPSMHRQGIEEGRGWKSQVPQSVPIHQPVQQQQQRVPPYSYDYQDRSNNRQRVQPQLQRPAHVRPMGGGQQVGNAGRNHYQYPYNPDREGAAIPQYPVQYPSYEWDYHPEEYGASFRDRDEDYVNPGSLDPGIYDYPYRAHTYYGPEKLTPKGKAKGSGHRKEPYHSNSVGDNEDGPPIEESHVDVKQETKRPTTTTVSTTTTTTPKPDVTLTPVSVTPPSTVTPVTTHTQISTTRKINSTDRQPIKKPSVGRKGLEVEQIIIASPTDSAQGPIVALALGLAFTTMLLLFVGCRLRTVKRRIRKGRPLHSNEADYLINGMYL